MSNHQGTSRKQVSNDFDEANENNPSPISNAKTPLDAMRCQQQGMYFEKKRKRHAKSLSQKEKNIFLMKHIKRPANEVQQMKISIS